MADLHNTLEINTHCLSCKYCGSTYGEEQRVNDVWSVKLWCDDCGKVTTITLLNMMEVPLGAVLEYKHEHGDQTVQAIYCVLEDDIELIDDDDTITDAHVDENIRAWIAHRLANLID